MKTFFAKYLLFLGQHDNDVKLWRCMFMKIKIKFDNQVVLHNDYSIYLSSTTSQSPCQILEEM